MCTDRDLCYTGTTSFYSPFKKSGYSKGMNGKNWTDNLISNRNCKHNKFAKGNMKKIFRNNKHFPCVHAKLLTLCRQRNSWYKTCSCLFVRYFHTLFWDDITIICWWKLSKQTSYWPKTGFFSHLKIIIKFHPKIS